MKVNIKEIAEELQTLSDEACFYYNKQTGELEYFNYEHENPNDLELEEVEDDEKFIRLPDKFDINDYGILKDFMFVQEDREIRDALYDIIHSKGVFKKFRQVVERFGILEKWYEFNNEEYEDIVKEWCEENALEWE